MFTGIVQNTARVKEIKADEGGGRILILSPLKAWKERIKIGDSLGCDGACLTVVKIKGNNLSMELMPETLRLTKFSSIKEGDVINLELPLKLQDFLSGHLVTGHIDGVGKVKSIHQRERFKDLDIEVPAKLKKYLAPKGSVAINGVSLTIASLKKNILKVCLIPHTLKSTNLSLLKVSDKLNMEIDILARYLESLKKNNET